MSYRRGLLALAVAAGCAAMGPAANAAYVITIQQDGNNVVAQGSGSFDTKALTIVGGYIISAELIPQSPYVVVGAGTQAQAYTGITYVGSGTGSMGTVYPNSYTQHLASSATGKIVGGMFGNGYLLTPVRYVSGTAMSGTATWDNTTYTLLGLTAGTYEWSWGTGATSDSLTVHVDGSPAGVPEPSSAALLAIPGMLVWLHRRRKRTAG